MCPRPQGWLSLTCVSAAILSIGCRPELPKAGGLVPAERQEGSLVVVEEAASSGENASPTYPASALLPTSIAPLPAASEANVQPPVPVIAHAGAAPVDPAQNSGQPENSPLRERILFRLSAGVAVPQSLPMGTVMAMSVDYQLAGMLDQSSRYVWVVSSQGEGNVEQVIRPLAQGTLQAFFLNLRPEHRPFQCHIDEIAPGGRRSRVSNVATMQTSY